MRHADRQNTLLLADAVGGADSARVPDRLLHHREGPGTAAPSASNTCASFEVISSAFGGVPWDRASNSYRGVVTRPRSRVTRSSLGLVAPRISSTSSTSGSSCSAGIGVAVIVAARRRQRGTLRSARIRRRRRSQTRRAPSGRRWLRQSGSLRKSPGLRLRLKRPPPHAWRWPSCPAASATSATRARIPAPGASLTARPSTRGIVSARRRRR